MLRGAPRSRVALRELAARLDGAVFTAHNAGFDAAFLRREAARDGVVLDVRPRLCTLELSRALDPDRLLNHGLAAVAERYGVSIERHHDALCDARAKAAVLPHLLVAHGVTDEDALAGVFSPFRPETHPSPSP